MFPSGDQEATGPVTALRHRMWFYFRNCGTQDVFLFQKLIKVHKQYVPSGKPLSYAAVLHALFKNFIRARRYQFGGHAVYILCELMGDNRQSKWGLSGVKQSS